MGSQSMKSESAFKLQGEDTKERTHIHRKPCRCKMADQVKVSKGKLLIVINAPNAIRDSFLIHGHTASREEKFYVANVRVIHLIAWS